MRHRQLVVEWKRKIDINTIALQNENHIDLDIVKWVLIAIFFSSQARAWSFRELDSRYDVKIKRFTSVKLEFELCHSLKYKIRKTKIWHHSSDEFLWADFILLQNVTSANRSWLNWENDESIRWISIEFNAHIFFQFCCYRWWRVRAWFTLSVNTLVKERYLVSFIFL